MELLACLIRGGKFRAGDGPSIYLEDLAAIHASPPCQAYTSLRWLHPHKEYPDLLAPTRKMLIETGKPWVIENVPGAPVHHSITLCGNMFSLRVYRHRLFETPFMIWQPEHKRHRILAGAKGTKGGRGRKAHYLAGGNVTVCGNVGSYVGPGMGIDWMTGKELSQAIPPAYCHFIGKQPMRFFEEPKEEPIAAQLAYSEKIKREIMEKKRLKEIAELTKFPRLSLDDFEAWKAVFADAGEELAMPSEGE